MEKFYTQWVERYNRPCEIKNKEEYYSDIRQIEDSFSGMVDAFDKINAFIFESARLLVNAIALYEKGYFDAAFYSLRSAIEISTTFVYLYDMPEEIKNNEFSAWKSQEKFPMQAQMIKKLSKNGTVFKDMQSKMSTFFDAVEKDKNRLHKYVHKQGFQHFYVGREHVENEKYFEREKQIFLYYLEKSIAIVAVMRLAIDPFPVLLMDEEIVYRCFESMTEPYTDDFVSKYLHKEVIDQYKTTEIYRGVADDLLSREKKERATFDVTNNQYINIAELETIFRQHELLSWSDRCAVCLVSTHPKISKIYHTWGMWYFTSVKSKRESFAYSSTDFDKFTNNEHKLNQACDNIFISAFKIGSEYYFIEHNDKLDANEIIALSGVVAILNSNAVKGENEMAKIFNEVEKDIYRRNCKNNE